MFSSWRNVVLKCWPLVVSMLVLGCSSDISEQTVVGTWSAASKDGIAPAFRINNESPGAKPSDVMRAAKVLATTSLELDGNKTFILEYGGHKTSGSWQFTDGELPAVELVVTAADDGATDLKSLVAIRFYGVFSRNTGSMRLYPASHTEIEEAKRRNDKGIDALSVVLNHE